MEILGLMVPSDRKGNLASLVLAVQRVLGKMAHLDHRGREDFLAKWERVDLLGPLG